MINNNLIFNLSMLYTASLTAFSLFIFLSIRKSNLYQSTLWIISNFMSAFSMLIPSVFVETAHSGTYSLISYAVSGTSLTLPYFALAGRQWRMLRFYKAHMVLVAAFVIMLTITALPYGWLPAVLGYSCGAAIVFATAWVCHKNRAWRGFRGQSILIFGLIACALLFLWRAWIVFDARNGIGFDIDPANTVLGLEILICISFCIQIGFLHLIVGRDIRFNLFEARRAARLFEDNRRMSAEQNRLSDLADERLFTLDLLTLEVRQPINNARAALEALDHAIGLENPKAAKPKLAIARAQGVLDSVTLAISNAIFAASFLEQNTKITRRLVDAHDVAELAKTDCPIDLSPRIEVNFDDNAVYVDMDPVLVRLALRNLLDNALKYSPPQSPIQFRILQREDLLGTSFTVTSQLTRLDLLDEAIFTRRGRGAGAQGSGGGLGLYLVKKVAAAHGGSVSYFIHDDAKVTFDLFIPDE